MSLKITCPSCGHEYPVEAGLLEDDGKRLAAVLANVEPQLARTALAYLRLFKPPKTALRTSRAITVLQELLELVKVSTVCKDERGGVHRPASPAAWCAGIEQLLQQPAKLNLPLGNHNYLRHVVFAIADTADARTERDRDQARRAVVRTGSADPNQERMSAHLTWLREQLARGQIDQASHDDQAAQTRAKYQTEESQDGK